MRAALLLLNLVGTAAYARTWRVDATGAGDYTTIQKAIKAASDGDAVEVQPGTYLESLDFLGKAISVSSTLGSADTILDAGGTATYAVSFATGEDDGSTLSGFTILNGTAQGMRISAASPVLSDLVFQDLGTTSANGGALVIESGSPVFDSVKFSGGGGWRGGQVYILSGEVSFSNSSFTDAYGQAGGAIHLASGTLLISDTVFDSNVSEGAGGAIYLRDGATLTLVDVDFTDNSTEAGHGAAIYADHGNTVSVTGGSFTGNASDTYDDGYYGGGIMLTAGDLSVTDTTFDSNYAYYGASIYTSQSDVSLVRTTHTSNYGIYGGALFIYGPGTLIDSGGNYDANTSYYYGGAAYIYYDIDASFTDTVFNENVAYYGYGGAIYDGYYGSLAVDGVEFTKNVAYYYGGGIYTYYLLDGLDVAGSSFDENVATNGYGGGIYGYYGTPISVDSSTFTWNEAYYSGGGVYQYYGAPLSLKDSSFSYNTAGALNGGGVYFYPYATDFSATVEGCDFLGNMSQYEGGGLYLLDPGAVNISGSSFVENTLEESSFGGGLFSQGMNNLTVDTTSFIGNEAENGAGAYISDLRQEDGSVVWTNNLFQENQAVLRGGGLLAVSMPSLSMVNNTLVGNLAASHGGGVYLFESPVDFRNNLVAWTIDGEGLYLDSETALESSTIAYNDWYQNTDGAVGGGISDDQLAARANLELDPELVSYSLDGYPSNDAFALSPTSPCVDAGDSELFDPDGSRSDIGFLGGPNAVLSDEDGDGYATDTDCDDEDATIYPGAEETWYDGVNQDCGAGSDDDADGDGVDGVDAGGEDCDDADASVTTGCDEVVDSADTGGDSAGPDTAEPPDDSGASGDSGDDDKDKCGCASGGAASSSALILSLLAGIALSRRRRP